MAQAIIGGLLRKDRNEFAPENLRVVEINPDTRTKLTQNYEIKCFTEAWKAIREDDIIIFAVKPQNLREAASELRAKGYTSGHSFSQLVISIAAGVRLSDLAKWLGGHTRLIRAMPNTPALIGEGITALYPLPLHVTEKDMQRAESILLAVGETVRVNDENEMNAVTAISGSGPAYVFMFMEAVEQAAIDLNLPKDKARKLVLKTFIGAARLAAVENSEPVKVLRERVTSKGGTTERALASMEADKVKEAIVRAIRAAAERSRELGDEFGKAD